MDVVDLSKQTIKSDLPSKPSQEDPRPFIPSNSREVVREWRAYEFSYYEKSRAWFLIGGGVFFLLVGYFTITKQIITSLTFLLLGITIYIFSLKKPRLINCQINRQEIIVDRTSYPFKDLISFWIFYEPPDFKVISLKHKKPYFPLIQIPMGDEDPMILRETLLSYLQEEEQEESFSDKMARYLRF